MYLTFFAGCLLLASAGFLLAGRYFEKRSKRRAGAALRALLDGKAGPYRDIVLLNAAAALLVANKAETLAEGVALGARAIDEGRARAALDKLVADTAAGVVPSAAASPAAGS